MYLIIADYSVTYSDVILYFMQRESTNIPTIDLTVDSPAIPNSGKSGVYKAAASCIDLTEVDEDFSNTTSYNC